MNLSSYLQMPPAPSVPNSTSIPTPQGGAAGAGPAAGGGLGIDFGQIMARQLQRLVPQERQSLAADTASHTGQVAREPDKQRPQEDKDTQTHEQSQRETHPARTEPSHQEAHPRARARSTTHKSDQDNATAAMSEAPTTPILAATPVAVTTVSEVTAQATEVTSQAAPLQTIELSPQVRIITDPQKAPSPESLAAFAKSMGLDESTIQHLLGEAPSGATTLTANPSVMGATATLGHATLGNTNGMPTLEGLVAAQLMAGPVEGGQTPVVASGAGLALGASTLTAPTMPGLSQADMAAIQQLQITVLPAAVLPVNTGVNAQVMPSTLEMLSLLGTSGVSDKEVSALLSQFSDSTDSDSNPDSEQSRPDGNNASSFSQALTRQTAATTAGAANATTHTSANMSEVYDQLSDKMATELAARMHKQLSDGEWKMKFGLRPSNLGGVEIQLEMKDGKLDAVFRADNPLTRDLLQNSSQRLREALGNFGINAGQVHVGDGGGNGSSNGQQNGSGNSTKQGQVRDNSTSQVNGTDSASSATSARNKANASLLDLYA
jgi:flagellar hook-length control protein FliK